MIHTDFVLDAKGLACPMPIVKTRKAMKDLQTGEVLEIQATDKGSTADLQAWAKSSGHLYLGTDTEGETLRHYLKKDGLGEVEETIEIPEISLLSFEELLNDSSLTILDVREEQEFKDAHIPGALHIPLGDVETRAQELPKNETIYLICHSGRRSAIAGNILAKAGYENLYNIVPGMRDYKGKTTSL
ncbi:sulfurtransferase TusA family protein [Chryseomicrobium aureum]|uniref:sulfurtransferase TusA family protein n=1 Tax=Chryseomicrobium aureum TaxID=1441723 RepID=UPI00359BC821